MKVLILNPRVGLTAMMSSPFSRFKMVVFPALSSPLSEDKISAAEQRESVHLQEKNPHLSLLPSVLPNYCEQAHVVDGTVVGQKGPLKAQGDRT